MVPAALSVTVAGTLAAAPAARRVKVAVVIVAAFTGLLNVAVTVLARGTPVAPFGGAWAITVGATSVVKLHAEAVPSGETGRAASRERAEIAVAAASVKKKEGGREATEAAALNVTG